MTHEEHTGSVTQLIDHLKQGESQAATEAWDRFFDRLVVLARRRLGNAPRRLADEEDVALSVMGTLIDGAAKGRFPKLQDRNELWKLLLVITRQKAVDQIREEMRAKRGGGDARGRVSRECCSKRDYGATANPATLRRAFPRGCACLRNARTALLPSSIASKPGQVSTLFAREDAARYSLGRTRRTTIRRAGIMSDQQGPPRPQS